MNPYANTQIRKMNKYSPPLDGRADYDGVLLDFNERTAPISKKISKALVDFAKSDRVQIYPEYGDLVEVIAKYTDTDVDQVMITNGSDQGIDLIFRTFTKKNDRVVIPSPTFQMFEQCAKLMENKVITVGYREDLAFPMYEVLELIGAGIKLLVICNPNNPTGTLVALEDVEKILIKAKNNGVLVYIDEAYFEFSKVTAAGFIKKYPNLIVSRTFSKAFGLASLRIGYLLASKENVSEMLKVRGPYDVSTPAAIAAKVALSDLTYVQDYVDEVMNESKPLLEDFFNKNEIQFFPSNSNFILFKPDNSQTVFDKLKQSKILTRPRSGKNIDGTIRVSIGTRKEIKKFIETYEKLFLADKRQKYAFLDRDGTLIFEPQDTFQIDSLEQLRLLDGVIESLKKIVSRGYKLAIVSNQNGIGTKAFPKENFEIPQNRLLNILEKNGITFDKVFICPHLPEDNCSCRKPKTGLLDDFFEEKMIDMDKSFMVGDRDTDRQFAENLGIKFAKMNTNGSFKEVLKQIKL